MELNDFEIDDAEKSVHDFLKSKMNNVFTDLLHYEKTVSHKAAAVTLTL